MHVRNNMSDSHKKKMQRREIDLEENWAVMFSTFGVCASIDIDSSVADMQNDRQTHRQINRK